ncbi:hypothetical protein RBE51_13420 [Pseudomonas taiwanensis]|uniref:hypothetical protein n=1 Tax=Pseudomonas taiwanensis TaxID=470150 RepID=UPI0028DDDB21|nr:hypothetical protein [Pseudomonas taiwanensis]MDT8923814.1 hypothetical protein [Pseudomonas taiwanensis]
MKCGETCKAVSLGAVLSVAWVVVAAFVIVLYSNGESLSASGWGDLFAGLFGPIAIIWIVLGFVQQGRQISLQVDELKDSIATQKQMVKITEQQLRHSIDVIERHAEPFLKISAGAIDKSQKHNIGELFVSTSGPHVTNCEFNMVGELVEFNYTPGTTLDEVGSIKIPAEKMCFDIPYVLTISYKKSTGTESSQSFEVVQTDMPDEQQRRLVVKKLPMAPMIHGA